MYLHVRNQQVAKGFRRAGYRVYALVRSQKHANELLKNEVIPVIGDQGKPETYREYVKQAAVVVDNVGDYENRGVVNRLLLKTAVEVG
jgi:fibrillarin-like rRNA methylase